MNLLTSIQKLAEQTGKDLAESSSLSEVSTELKKYENKSWQGELPAGKYSREEVYEAMVEACRCGAYLVLNSFEKRKSELVKEANEEVRKLQRIRWLNQWLADNESHVKVLTFLRDRPRLFHEIKIHLGMDRVQLSRITKQLDHNGLINRELDIFDKDYVQISLTKDGRNILDKL